MSHLTEVEIIDRMKHSIREAIQAAKDLSVHSRYGEPYRRLRDSLALIEGCCRQMAAFRGDATWLPFGIFAAECHKRAGGWLRGFTKEGVYIHYTPGVINEVFVSLGTQLTAILEVIEHKTTAKTNTLGPVLPQAPAAERRIGAPVRGHRLSSGGIILPPTLN